MIGFIMFPNPEFYKYTKGNLPVAKWYPAAIPIAFPSLAAITWFDWGWWSDTYPTKILYFFFLNKNKMKKFF